MQCKVGKGGKVCVCEEGVAVTSLLPCFQWPCHESSSSLILLVNRRSLQFSVALFLDMSTLSDFLLNKINKYIIILRIHLWWCLETSKQLFFNQLILFSSLLIQRMIQYMTQKRYQEQNCEFFDPMHPYFCRTCDNF